MKPNPSASRALAAVTAAAVVLVLATPILAQRDSAVPSKPDVRTITHVLNRIGFGARPGDIERVQALGLAKYIDSQLHPDRIPNDAMNERLAGFPTLSMKTSELMEKYFAPADALREARQREQAQQARRQTTTPPDPAMAGGVAPPTPPNQPAPTPEERMIQQQQQNVANELMQAKILRATMSERQLEEVLVDFWFNHFNVFIGKGQVRQYLTEYERDAIRPHVLGTFRDMLGATAHSPAMLFYLDNFQSATPAPPVQVNDDMARRMNDPRLSPQQRQQLTQRLEQMRNQQRPSRGLNENYARELMELHTLGVDAGYTQKDVQEMARVFTGWTIDQPRQGGNFVFRPQMHDTGTKVVLGTTFQAGGQDEGERALDMLAKHPATAKHIAFKLAQRFVADEPPKALVDRAAKRFLDTKGDLREVTRVIVMSKEFFEQDAYRSKVKTPLEFVVSAARAANATVVNAQPFVQALRTLGMPLYGAQPPTGYSMTADAWVNTGSLLNRMNFAVQLLNGGQMEGVAGRGRGQGPNAQNPNAPRPNRPQPQALRPAQLARMPIQVDINALAPDTTEATRDRLIGMLLAGDVSEATRATLARAETPQNLIALTLGSPEFQKR